MQVKRLFTNYNAKGSENYLNTQKKYELIRTLIMFTISLSLFAATTVRRFFLVPVCMNPAAKRDREMVNMIMVRINSYFFCVFR